jgi:hypothetical protein
MTHYYARRVCRSTTLITIPEPGDKLRVKRISPGFANTDFADSMTSPDGGRCPRRVSKKFPH